MERSRYDRQERVQGWNQAALLKSHVLVAGAGALGNELIKNLVLLGIGHLLVVDFDHIESSNLSRTVLFRDDDVGWPKAEVAAKAAAELNPEVDIRYMVGDLFYDLGLGFYRHSDVVVGCLDNLAARSRVGVSCALAGVPFLDGGMWGFGGEVRWFMAGDGPCFDCTLDETDRARAYERRSCTGFAVGDSDEPPQSTTAFTGAVIGGLLAQETVRYVCGMKVHEGEALVYNGMSLSMHRSTLSRSDECGYHTARRDVVKLNWGVRETRVSKLLERAEREVGEHPIVELGRDFLIAFACDNCDRREEVNELLRRVDESRSRCGNCGFSRKAEIVSRIDSRSPYIDRRLCELGVPPGEVLAVRSGQNVGLYEFSSDVDNFWA
jgi:molybdopterin/thiamine biosynthesis adenylyltransferase